VSVTINGKTYQGKNIVVNNNVVTIDGKRVDAEPDDKQILHVKVEGDLHNLDTDGSASCGNVTGYVDAGGSVNCGNVGRYVDAGGSVNCGSVGGNIDAGGSVHHA
jgi:hypothetical protein